MTKERRSAIALIGLMAATPVVAADLPSKKAVVVMPPAPTLWTGAYAGLNVGYEWSNPSIVYGAEYALPPLRRTGATGAGWVLQSPVASGFFGGAQLGYNHQIHGTGAVVGAEVDFQGAGMRGTSSGVGSKNITGAYFPLVKTSQSINWFGTVRGRIGYTILPSLLAYGTGGFAYGGGSNNFGVAYSDFYDFGGASSSFTRTGWTAGGGLEWAMWNNISIKAEYLYVDLGQTAALGAQQICFCSGPTTPHLDYFAANQSGGSNRFHSLRAGVNYHFNWASLPVIGM